MTAFMDDVQATGLIRDTGNGPTLPREEEERLLFEMFGEPDENGVYGRPADGDA